ncbi:MAG: hypothetical protein AM325_014250 [Candidatus Thorarchaeota archaeon SMTZ1-45]|nr:MAG: hypothetical protein AM325_15595 [Candidatus Thorarchaeota archaeon SMTZ1-45]
MVQDDTLPDIEYHGICPYSERTHELQINVNLARFILPREKKRKWYQAVFDADWNEVISYEVCEVHIAKNGETWPIGEEIVDEKFTPMDSAGMVFLFTMPYGKAVFPVWTTIPIEDVPQVREWIEKRLESPSLPGLAHHGTAAAVKYILDQGQVQERIRAEWNDWVKKGRMAKPNPKFRERGPDYVYCKEGMAIDFYGAGEQLEQMSTFWPWRKVKRVFADHQEFTVRYEWHEDAYLFNQQVLDDDARNRFNKAAQNALDTYNSSDDVKEFLLIRPWSFPSRFHRTWDKLEAFSSKASRNRFPPIYDYMEEY